jgi:hypothetical protein
MAHPTNITTLPVWLPPADAARTLGIAERTLRLRASRGELQRRRDGRQTLYRIDPQTTAAAHRGVPTAAAGPTSAGAGDVASIVALAERAIRAEIEAERLRLELDTMRRQAARAWAGWQGAKATVDQLTAAIVSLRQART